MQRVFGWSRIVSTYGRSIYIKYKNDMSVVVKRGFIFPSFKKRFGKVWFSGNQSELLSHFLRLEWRKKNV